MNYSTLEVGWPDFFRTLANFSAVHQYQLFVWNMWSFVFHKNYNYNKINQFYSHLNFINLVLYIICQNIAISFLLTDCTCQLLTYFSWRVGLLHQSYWRLQQGCNAFCWHEQSSRWLALRLVTDPANTRHFLQKAQETKNKVCSWCPQEVRLES